jgi:hypothetical protein
MPKSKFTISEDDDQHFALIGISTTEERYRCISLINDCLGAELLLDSRVPFSLKGKPIYNFSLYHYSHEETGVEIFFVANLSDFEELQAQNSGADTLFSDVPVEERARLIRELPGTDYFIILRGEAVHRRLFDVMEKLRKGLPAGISIQNLDPQTVGSRKNLVFW